MASVILRRRGLLALERATNQTSSLRLFSVEPSNKDKEESPGAERDGKIDFGEKTPSTYALARIIRHFL